MRLVFVALVAIAGCAARSADAGPVVTAGAAAAPADARRVWDRLTRQLPGAWEARTRDGSTIHLSYRLVSAGTVLVETYVTPSGSETLTVYHRDRDRLLLTHYCAQGNQPRLRLVEAPGDMAVFQHFDATNVQPGQAMLVERTLRITANGLELSETYRQPDGTTETTVLVAIRAATSTGGASPAAPTR